MNNTTTSQWPQSDLAPLLDDDFSNLLDFENVDFSLLDSINPGGKPLGILDGNTDMPDASFYLDSNPFDCDAGNQVQHLQQQRLFYQNDTTCNTFTFDTPQSYALQYNSTFSAPPTQNFHAQGSVPPTPISTNIPPESYQCMQHHDPQTSHRWAPYQLRKDDAMALNTPLVSPEVHSNDVLYPYMLDFSLNNPYGLSPLTPPAIQLQNNVHRTPFVQSHTADSSLAASPIDLNFHSPQETPSSVNEQPKRTRRKLQTSRPSSRGRGASATSGALRRGSLSVSSLGPDSISTILESQAVSAIRDGRTLSQQQSVFDSHETFSSSTKSMSPLPELAMAPPPKPITSRGTQALATQPHPTIDTSIGQHPATPASMMRLQQLQSNEAPIRLSPAVTPCVFRSPALTPFLRASLDDFHLPDAAVPHTDDAHSTPKPNGTTVIRRKPTTPAMSSNNSPALGPTYSPSITANTPKLDGKGGRNSRKRLSAAISLISPALRPKISPSIKPLLPEGANLTSVSEAHALLLASKSNYQNIIEGNQLPGVTYPSELTSNLSSKRTSHKLAEQGRRNRINTALQELQTLLPAVIGSPSTTKDADAEKSVVDSPASPTQDAELPSGSRTPALSAQQSNSKAATVELAIEHIKLLKEQMAEKEVENEKLKREMAEMKEALERAGILRFVSSGKSESVGNVGSTPSKDAGRGSDVDVNMKDDDNDGDDSAIKFGDGKLGIIHHEVLSASESIAADRALVVDGKGKT